jgi:hypothetical protein
MGLLFVVVIVVAARGPWLKKHAEPSRSGEGTLGDLKQSPFTSPFNGQQNSFMAKNH